jgi:surfactin synthase thioesterase subunit
MPGPGAQPGATVIFPHAGGSAVSYRPLAAALATGGDTFIVQYPQRADRFHEPAAETIPDLAASLFEAAPWHRIAPLRLFGHSMGSLVAFEFARIAEPRGLAVPKLWASAGPAPSAIAELPELPTDEAGLRADIADLGGTDPRLLADKEFAELVINPVRSDYRALNRYSCEPQVRVRADIHAVGGRSDHRVDADRLPRWADHTAGDFAMSLYDGGHFYLNEHVDALAAQVNADAG